MTYTYKTQGTCSSSITFDLQDDVVTNISFTGGCSGNLQGVSILADGLTVEQIVNKCDGIFCGKKLTSCPDQLAKALIEAKAGRLK